MSDTGGAEQPRPDGTQTVAVMARLLNLTPRRLQQLAIDGVIPKAERGRYLFVPVVQGYVKYLQDLVVGKGPDAHQKATTTLAEERAKKAARENALAAGELIPKADVVAGMQTVFAHVKARLLALPTKLAPVMDMLETTAEKKDKITESINDALEELTNTRAIFKGSDGASNGASDNRKPRRAKAAAGSKRKRVVRPKQDAKSGKQRGAGKVGNRKG